MALLGHGENRQRQSFSSFRETKLSITALLLTCEKNKFLSSYSLHEHGYYYKKYLGTENSNVSFMYAKVSLTALCVIFP
jgi:hypothetical protein